MFEHWAMKRFYFIIIIFKGYFSILKKLKHILERDKVELSEFMINSLLLREFKTDSNEDMNFINKK